jgi:hypothetical protein
MEFLLFFKAFSYQIDIFGIEELMLMDEFLIQD